MVCMEEKQIFIPKDSFVKVYFKNGTIIEGIVLTWNDRKGLLCSSGNQSRMIVYNPAENVMMIKICSPEEESNQTEPSLSEPEVESEEYDQPIAKAATPDELEDSVELEEEIEVNVSSIADRTKKMVKYRLSQASQDKKYVADTLKRGVMSDNPPIDSNKQPPEVEVTYYESPNFTQRGPIVSTRKKENRSA